MSSLAGKYEEIDVELIEANAWNPNEMDEKTFNRLAEELENTGVIDPIQVVALDTGKYRILGGEHRWRAMTVLGYEKIPCVVLTDAKWRNEDLQKFVTTRLNALRGKLNPEKFMKMYMDMSSRYDKDSMDALMGFTDQDAFRKLIGDTKQGLKDAGLPLAAQNELEKITDELKTVDGLSEILNRIFNKYGSTLDQHFMWFDFGGKEHLYVQIRDKRVWKSIKGMMEESNEKKIDAQDLFYQLILGWQERAAAVGLIKEDESDDSLEEGEDE